MKFLTGGPSDVVDIFNSFSGEWSTASLSVARKFLCATSLPDRGLAFVAGGLQDPGAPPLVKISMSQYRFVADAIPRVLPAS